MQREDIHIIAKNSNLSEQRVSQTLQEKVYNGREDWKKFLRLFFLSLGIGFAISGIVFFFAYNWDDLHKFAKIGLIEGLLITTTSLLFFPKISKTFKNFALLAASILVGVLFAVFGQIYQTGANAYDFFLAWTLFVSIWIIISNFAPLWLLYLVLINTTFLLYSQQVAQDWSGVFICTVLFVFNLIILLACHFLHKKNIPNWLTQIIALTSISYATIGIIFGIFDNYPLSFLLLLILSLGAYAMGIWHSLKTKNAFYLSVIPFSLIIIVTAFFIQITYGDMAIFFILSLFIIISITLTIKTLIEIQNNWKNEK